MREEENACLTLWLRGCALILERVLIIAWGTYLRTGSMFVVEICTHQSIVPQQISWGREHSIHQVAFSMEFAYTFDYYCLYVLQLTAVRRWRAMGGMGTNGGVQCESWTSFWSTAGSGRGRSLPWHDTCLSKTKEGKDRIHNKIILWHLAELL